MSHIDTSTREPLASSSGQATGWAWGLCWLMFASTVLNYMDRQAISLVRPQIMDEFGIDFQTFGWIMAAFSLTYALFQVPAGHLTDRLDVRRLYPAAVVWWSLAGIAVVLTPSPARGVAASGAVLGFLVGCRVLLGVGEAFNWPCALKVTGRILPPRDRSLGNGIFNSGAAVGAVLTPLIIPVLTVWKGWRAAFALVGALGFAWVLGWLLAMRSSSATALRREPAPESGDPEVRLRSGPSPVALGGFAGLAALAATLGALGYRGTLGARLAGPTGIWVGVALLMIGLLVVARLLPLRELGAAGWAFSLGRVVRHRRFWVLVVVTVSINICWHFLVGWLPTYFKEDRKLAVLVEWMRELLDRLNVDADPAFLVSSMVTAVVFLAADAGNLLGGLGARRLVAAGLRTDQARWRVMAACALLISGGAWVGRVESDAVVVALLAVMALGAAAFMANYFAFCQEVDSAFTGLIVGILGGLGNLFAAGILPFAGWVKDTYQSFGPIFVLVGLSPFVGLAALALAWGKEGATTPESA